PAPLVEPDLKPDPKPIASDFDRTAAEYVLSIGGKVTLDNGLTIHPGTALPQQPFLLTGCNLGSNLKVTDAGLEAFRGCKNLTELNLASTTITDAGLANFKDCKNLQRLLLTSPGITDRGLALFGDCKELRSLAVGGAELTDAALAHFKNCKNLLD